MNALSIDTATDVLNLAALSDDCWATFCVRRGLQHSPALLPVAERLLAELSLRGPDLNLIVCSLGPGSFTGIRIGLATAMGMGQGLGIPVVGVSTLDAIARTWASHDGDLFPVIDARKGRIYTARYRRGQRQGDFLDVPPQELARLLAQAERPLLAGTDAERIRALLGEQGRDAPVADLVDPRSLLRAGIVMHAQGGSDGAVLQPLYLRKSEAELMSEQ